MISAMPAVAVRRERKKQRAAAAAAAASASASGSCSSRQGSLSSLASPSTRSSSLLSSPLSSSGNYYSYFASQRPATRRPSSVSGASVSTAAGGRPAPSTAPPSRRPSASTGVSTISSAASNYVSALHKVRERQLATRRERARFLAYTGSVLLASGAVLAAIGLASRLANAQAVGLLFLCLGCGFCLARALCLAPLREELPVLVRRGASGQSMYAPSTAHQSAATTPGTDDSSTTSSYYFSAVPLHQHRASPLQSPEAPPAAAPPPLQPPPVVPGVHGAGGGHRGTSASLLTPMSLNSIPEMQVLITDDSQRY